MPSIGGRSEPTRITAWDGISRGDPVRFVGQRRGTEWWFSALVMGNHKAHVEIYGGKRAHGFARAQRMMRSVDPNLVHLDKKRERLEMKPIPVPPKRRPLRKPLGLKKRKEMPS